MKKFFSLLFAGMFLIMLLPSQVSAQRGLPKLNRKALMDSLSPEQKKEFRKNLRARYDSLSPEQKQKFRERMKNRSDSTLSPQQKTRLRKRLQNNPATTNG